MNKQFARKTRSRGRYRYGVAVGAATAVLTAVSVAGYGSVAAATTTAGTSSAQAPAGWPLANGNGNQTRYVGGPINSKTVSKLGVSWTMPIPDPPTAFGSFASVPVVVNGVVYAQDLFSNVFAISKSTGQVLWTKDYNSPTAGPNGLVVAGGEVFGATSSFAFALSAATGAELWENNALVNDEHEAIDMTPGFHAGTVYVSTVPGNPAQDESGAVGTLYALNASTGAVKWYFDTVPASLWGDPTDNWGGGLWAPPTFDNQGNLYIGTANPGPFIGTAAEPWGSSRPGPDLYTDSIVKLNEKTGAVEWYYQLTPHDLYDLDLQNPPMLTTVNGQPAIVDAGKAGIVIALNANTGKLIWKTPVGTHNGHDNDNLLAENGQYSKLPTFPFTVFPGSLGGVEAAMATNGSVAVAAVNNLSNTWTGQDYATQSTMQDPSLGTGDLVAINQATGKVKWDVALSSSPYGGATIVNDLVFTTLFDGTLAAYNINTGQEVWQTQLPAVSNAPVAVDGDTLIVGAGIAGSGQQAEIIAFKLGASGS